MSILTPDSTAARDFANDDGMLPKSQIRWTLAPLAMSEPMLGTADWPAIRGYRDLAIHELADSEALQRERIASLEQDVASYRALAIESMAMSVRLTAQLDAARRTISHQRRDGRTS